MTNFMLSHHLACFRLRRWLPGLLGMGALVSACAGQSPAAGKPETQADAAAAEAPANAYASAPSASAPGQPDEPEIAIGAPAPEDNDEPEVAIGAPGPDSVDVQRIPEMAELPGGWLPLPPEQASLQPCIELMQRAWPSLAPQIRAGLDSATLRLMSKWAVEETASYRVPEAWLDQLKLAPLYQVSGKGSVIFGHHESKAAALPSHTKAVTRRLFVFVECQREGQTAKLGSVSATIRGELQE